MKKKFILASVVASLAFLLFLCFADYEGFWYKRLLPEKMGITHRIAVEGDSGLMEGCGIAAFTLSDSTLEHIKKQGLKFFDDALQSRRMASRITYQPWKMLPGDEFEENILAAGFALRGERCAPNFLNDWGAKVNEAATHSGGFYTTGHKSEILVLPQYKIVVFSYFG
jgi:hypothetical protein